jgi:hypothetical protein
MTLPNGEPLRYDMGPEFVWNGNVPARFNPKHAMQQNDISITITAEQEAAILAKADELRTLIDAFAVSITDADRAGYFKLGDARLAFDEKCDNYMHQHPELVPAGINLAEYDRDGAAAEAIKRVRAKISTIDTRLADTQTVLGADRLDADLAFYNYLDFAARTGAAGAADIHSDLRGSYPGGRRSKASPPPAPAH